MSRVGHINQYVCEKCGGRITTVDRDEGTTPYAILCRYDSECSGFMFSQMYLVDQALVPSHEWYKPRRLWFRLPSDRIFVKQGGLLLRKIKGA